VKQHASLLRSLMQPRTSVNNRSAQSVIGKDEIMQTARAKKKSSVQFDAQSVISPVSHSVVFVTNRLNSYG